MLILTKIQIIFSKTRHVQIPDYLIQYINDKIIKNSYLKM